MLIVFRIKRCSNKKWIYWVEKHKTMSTYISLLCFLRSFAFVGWWLCTRQYITQIQGGDKCALVILHLLSQVKWVTGSQGWNYGANSIQLLIKIFWTNPPPPPLFHKKKLNLNNSIIWAQLRWPLNLVGSWNKNKNYYCS